MGSCHSFPYPMQLLGSMAALLTTLLVLVLVLLIVQYKANRRCFSLSESNQPLTISSSNAFVIYLVLFSLIYFALDFVVQFDLPDSIRFHLHPFASAGCRLWCDNMPHDNRLYANKQEGRERDEQRNWNSSGGRERIADDHNYHHYDDNRHIRMGT